MWTRFLWATVGVIIATGQLRGQSAADTPHRTPLRVSAGNGTLPNEQGQVWREYDISPYTTRVTSTRQPEQAIVDWILRETGYQAWHSEPLAILSATPRTLRVYHTPQVQAVVAGLVERFVAGETHTQTFNLRVFSIENPNWRAGAKRALRPVPAQSPAACAWLLPKEEAAFLMADLQRRSDFRELGSQCALVSNGQSTLVSLLRGRPYVRDVVARPGTMLGVEAKTAQIDEGISLELSPLVSADGRTIDAVVKCSVDQVEKFLPVLVEVPEPNGARQRARIDVPQMTHFRFEERFQWPTEQALLVSLGVVALPASLDGKPAAGVSLPLWSSSPRADLLVLIERKGRG